MEHEGKGGSYIRQRDGQLQLVGRTEEAKPSKEERKAPAVDAPAEATGKKGR